jgi:death-on-curing protein
MNKITKEQVIYMHKILINETGGSHGVRDNGLLESAFNAPFQSFDGEYLCKNLQLKAGKLCFLIVKKSPFC